MLDGAVMVTVYYYGWWMLREARFVLSDPAQVALLQELIDECRERAEGRDD